MYSDKKSFVEVAVALPVSKTFTYEVPEPIRPLAVAGKRVIVPFGPRQVTGYILDLLNTTDQENTKKVLDILDDHPLFPTPMIRFFRWIGDYYIYPVGEVIKGAIPGGLNPTYVHSISITQEGCSALSGQILNSTDRVVLQALEVRRCMDMHTLSRAVNMEITPRTLRGLERAGYVIRQHKLKPGRVRAKKELYVAAVDGRPSASSLSEARQRILSAVEGSREMSLRALKSKIPSAGRLVRKMAAEQFLAVVERSVYRDPLGEPIEADLNPPILTQEQESVVTTVLNTLNRGFQTHLLYGITGSGKTEVYMQAVARVLERGCQALVLVPEIALVSQTERLFRARFGDCIALLHSGLSRGERFDQWMRIVHNEAKIGIGARSAIFAPFDNLGLIVVDEEHDESYKQEGGLRYNARDLAVVRAKLQGAVTLLGSATPSMQSYYNVLTRKFQGLSLRKRIESQDLPEVTVVDLRQPEGSGRAKSFMTEELKAAMSETLTRKEQVLLFLNRRGFASCPTCTSCGAPVRCNNCDVTMTFHQKANCFRCHYCGYTAPQAAGCKLCGNLKVIPIGLGTEKVEAKVRALFPDARVARMDRDTTARKGAVVKILRNLRKGAIDILVGTQMVAKGHHYPNITLVGILCADLSLNFPDFRSGERTYQLLAQVAGRAGRGESPGRVILQTFNPEHFCITTARDQDYFAFYKKEIRFRKTATYPPCCRLVQILVVGSDKEETAQYARKLAEICRSLQAEKRAFQNTIELLGPVTAPLARIKRQFRWQLLLKGHKVGPLHELVRTLNAKAQREIPARGIKMIIDVDPVNML